MALNCELYSSIAAESLSQVAGFALRDHTVSLYESIPNAQLAIVPGTSHAVLKEKPELVKKILQDFYRNPSFPMTLNPNRRLKETLRMSGQA